MAETTLTNASNTFLHSTRCLSRIQKLISVQQGTTQRRQTMIPDKLHACDSTCRQPAVGAWEALLKDQLAQQELLQEKL